MLSRAYQNNSLPKWAYFALALVCAAIGLWASSITLQYFEHGAKALEADPALQALAVAAAFMFVASEMSAFSIAAMLIERPLWVRKWMLSAFAWAVLALEVVTIVAVQLALTTGADFAQSAVASTAAGLQRQIDAVERSATDFSVTAASFRAADQLKKAGQYADKAAAEQDKLPALRASLTALQAQKRPTLVGLLGNYALAYAIARGVLVSLGGLVFFGTAGALVRVGRSAASGATVAPEAPAETVAPAPALPVASFRTGTVAPMSYTSKTVMAGAGALAAMASPMAQSTLIAVPTSGQAGVPVSVQQATTAKVKTVQPRVQRDTGTVGKSAGRYELVRAGVIAGTIKPSIRGIQAAEGGSKDVVGRYIKQLAADGLIVPHGRGYALKGGAK